MKQVLFFLTGSTLLLSACSSHNGAPATAGNDTLRTADTSKTALVKKDTFKINGPLIVFTNPDDETAKEMMGKDSDSFYTIADDNAFYNSQIMELADSLTIKTGSTDNAVLDFKTTNNRHFIIDRSELKDMEFANYFFNGADTPQVANMDYDRAFLKKYFNK